MASAGGAVLSAVIASLFGVKGTIVGVAIGSVAATMGSALLFQSIERTHDAVKQVVVRVPDSTTLLRRLGHTKAAGITESEPAGGTAPAEVTATSAVQVDGPAHTATSGPVDQPTGQVPGPARPAPRGVSLRWPVVFGAVAGVFVLSLLLVTAVELIAGRPLADLFGGHGAGGTTVERIFENPPPTLPPTTTTTSTTTTSTSSTTSTSTTVPSSTTTSVPGTSTSSSVGSTSTTSGSPTTTVPGAPPSTAP